MQLDRNGEVETIRVDWVSENYFSVLGLQPALGQTFVPAEKWNASDDPPVVISYGMWQRRFGSDPAIVGKRIVLGRRNAVIRGVAPQLFGGLQKGFVITEIWLPINAWVGISATDSQWIDSKDYDVLLGRLRPGVGIREARAELDTITRRMALTYPANNDGISYSAFLKENDLLSSLKLGAVCLSGPFLILIICCANVSGIVLAQAEGRRGEIAMRLALGSGRRRIIRQLLIENLPVVLLGAGLGLVFTIWFIGLQSALLPPLPFDLHVDLRVDLRVLLFSLVVSICASLFAGLIPALQILREEAATSLKYKMGRTAGRGLLAKVFVTGQVALSLTLLVGTGLFLKSMLASEQIDPGFDSRKKLLILNVTPSNWQGDNETFFQPAIERIRSLPGVKGATYAGHMLLSGRGDGASVDVFIPGVKPPDGQKGFIVKFNAVGRDYFQTMGTRIIRGRAFDRSDEFPNQRTAIINETMAKRFWPKADPIGMFVKVEGKDHQIVGLAQDNRDGDIHQAPVSFIYLPRAQVRRGDSVVIVDTKDDPLAIAGAVIDKIRSVDKMASVDKPETLKGIMSVTLYQDRMFALFSGALGAFGIILAAIGLYAVVAYLGRCRTHEIGIRMSLGAQYRDISRLVLGSGFRLCFIGIAVGVVISFFAMRLLADLFYGVAATDLWIFSAGSLLVLAVSLLASYIPARRAARIDPIAALRYE